MLSLLLCLRVRKESSYAERSTFITDFGFKSNGWAYLELTSPRLNTSYIDRTVTALLMNKNELKNFNKMIDKGIPDCLAHISTYNSSIMTSSGVGRVNITLNQKDVYHIYVIPCQTGFSSRFQIQAVLKNTDTYLDFRDGLGLYIQPVLIALENVVVALWLIVAFYHHRPCSGVYVALTIIHFTYLVYLSFDYLQLFKNHRGEDTEQLDIFKHFETASTSFLFIFLIIAGSGWGMCRDVNLFTTLTGAVVLVMIYVLSPILVDVLSMDYFWIIFAGLQIVSIALMIRMIFRSTSEARLRVLAHLYAIDDKGIDSLQTPVYEKYKMFMHFRIAGIIALVVIPIISHLIRVKGWMIHALVTLLYLSVLWYITWLLRSRGPDADLLFLADTDPDYARKCIKIGNLRAIDKNRDLFGGNNYRSYTKGMSLPNAPKIILGIPGTGTLLSMESRY